MSMFADWTRRKTEFSEQYELVLYDRVWTCSETETVSDTLQTQTNIASESNSLIEPETPSSIISETLNVTQTQTSTQTGLNTLSASDSRTRSSSESTSQTISDTESKSNFISGTRSLSASESLSHSNSPTFAETASKTLTRLSGLLAAWNQSTGVYQDATTQGSRYSSSANVVTDALTGLQWELIPSPSTMTWAQAVDYCVASRTGTYDDWRLPNNAELESLVDYTINYVGATPGINAIFTGTPTSYFYSSTPLVGSPTQQPWWMSFGQTACYSGLLYSLQYSPSCAPAVASTGYARCVRSPYRPLPAVRYTTTSDTVTDTITGLIWQRVSTGGPMNQTAALAYCSALSLPSFGSGWRLPKVKELATLIDYSVPYGKLMMDGTVFAGEPANSFWSSTPVAGFPSSAWYASFNGGDLLHSFVANTLYVRCLR